MQCQSNGDCTGFNLTTKMKKKGKKEKICPNSWSAREKTTTTWVAWFVFLLDWCYVVCFSYFLHMRDSCLLFWNAVMIKQDTYMNIRMRLAVNQYMQIRSYSLQLSLILCVFFVFFYNPHSQWLLICFVFWNIFFFKLTRSLWTPTPSSLPQFYTHKFHSVGLHNTRMASCV